MAERGRIWIVVWLIPYLWSSISWTERMIASWSGDILPGNQMGGEQLLLGAGLPDVEIVDLRHGGDRQQVVPDLNEIDARRHGVQKGVDRLPDDLVDFTGDDNADHQ